MDYGEQFVLGAVISIASTSVIVKVLREMKREHEPFAELIYGILIVEDLLGVVMIVLLTGIASTGDSRGAVDAGLDR